MSNINSFLLRDMLTDDGKLNHTAYASSPDLICHPLVENPKAFFTENYAKDVTKAIDTNSKTNALYVRGKNLTQSTVNGRVQVYRSCASLFMTPSIWRNNILYTAVPYSEDPKTYTEFNAAANSIAVCQTPLVIDGTYGSNFCLVGIASDSNGPVIPADFRTYDSFVKWVTTNPGVCVRNHTHIQLGTKNEFEFAARIMNPDDKEVIGAFVIEITNAVRDTTYGIKCTALGIDAQSTLDNDTGTDKFSVSTFVDPSVDTFVTVYANSPNGQSLPPGINVSVSFHYGSLPPSSVYHLSKPVNAVVPKCSISEFNQIFASKTNRFRSMGGDFRLTLLGRCSVTNDLYTE